MNFTMKNLGAMKYFLQIEVTYSCQDIQDLLTESGFPECQPVRTPVEVNHKLTLNESEEMDVGRYQRLVRKLTFLVHTRPDVS